MQPPLTVTDAYPRSASSRRMDATSGTAISPAVAASVSVAVDVAVGLRDEGFEDRERSRRHPGTRVRRVALRRSPAQRHRLARRLALGPRGVVEIEAALGARH